MNRVVLDTNIVVSAFLWGGTPRLLITGAIESGIILLSSDDILAELERTLNKSKFDDQFRLIKKTRSQITSEYSQLTTIVVPTPLPAGIVRDAKDDMILAAAVGGNADAVVSGDKDLTSLKTYEKISILTPVQFLAILNPPDEASADDPQAE